MAAKSSASFRPAPLSEVRAVSPGWLEKRLGDPTLRVLDVRAGRSGGLTGSVELRAVRSGDDQREGAFAPLAGAPRWRAGSAEREVNGGGEKSARGDVADGNFSEAFATSHIPGANALDVRRELFDDVGDVVSAPELALVMSRLGVGDEHTIVFVDDARPGHALAAAWALARYGHRDVCVLEGGFDRWFAEGRPVSTEVMRHPFASFTARASR